MLHFSNILDFQFHNPQKNLSGNIHKRSPEREFAEQFTKAYRKSFLKIHSGTSKKNTLFIQEAPIFGNGIADLLVFSWSYNSVRKKAVHPDFEKFPPTIRAFEFKMSDWRKGMMQAHRYKYFSHASILVLPREKLKPAESQLDTFKKLRVGLWGFSQETGIIYCLFTPRPKQQHVPKHGQKAIELANQAMCYNSARS